MADVLANSPSCGANRLVEIAIAERADENGCGSRGSVEDVARRANLGAFREKQRPASELYCEKPTAEKGKRRLKYLTDCDCPGCEFEKALDRACRSARRSIRALEQMGRLGISGKTVKGVRIYRVFLGRAGADTTSGVEGRGGPGATRDGHSVRWDRTTDPVAADTVSPKPSLNPKSKSSKDRKQDLEKAKKLNFLKANLADAHEPERTNQLIAALEDELACVVEIDRSLDRLAAA